MNTSPHTATPINTLPTPTAHQRVLAKQIELRAHVQNNLQAISKLELRLSPDQLSRSIIDTLILSGQESSANELERLILQAAVRTEVLHILALAGDQLEAGCPNCASPTLDDELADTASGETITISHCSRCGAEGLKESMLRLNQKTQPSEEKR